MSKPSTQGLSLKNEEVTYKQKYIFCLLFQAAEPSLTIRLSYISFIISTENKNNLVHNVQESGDTFKAKGDTGGDVVRKGKPDPYAFIQLNPKVK